ncbi:hypothetical protein WA026_011150 [Henosepilachna vigintioctopunctata]
MSFGGDIFKFSGDAFLALWKCKDENQIIRDYINQALDCALVIQKNYGSFETDVGTLLKVKLAIAAGPVIFSLIGNQKYSHYIVIGKPIMDVKDAEHRSQAGEIIVAPSAWLHVNATDYIATDLEGSFKKVLGVGPSWRHMKSENKYSISSSAKPDDDDFQSTGMDSDEEEIYAQKKTNMEFALRPVMHQAGYVSESLRKFILPPVMTCIDQNEPIEYLTEMRRTVIMFINLTSKRGSYDALAHLVNECYLDICRIAEIHKGCVNKVSLFDKDIMFVLIFGLRGCKNDLEAQNALKCGYMIFETLNNHKTLKTVSIACTAGKTYCGIVGHTLRREYTVMGLIVNKAARIMVNYPDRVACDSSTFQQSKLEAKNFILQVYKPLKGISNPGPIYEYQEMDSTTADTASLAVKSYPILGRDSEVQMYIDNLKLFVRNSENVTDKLPPYVRMMAITGLARQGKTRLLEEFLFRTGAKLPVNNFSLSEHDVQIPYGTARTVLLSLFHLEELSLDEIKKKIIILAGPTYRDYLVCMNEIFRVNFKSTWSYIRMTEKERVEVTAKIIKTMCYSGLSSPHIVTIDLAEFLDEGTWKTLHSMLACRYLFFVISMAARSTRGPMAQKVLKHRAVQVIELTNILRTYQAGIACQILNVFAISADLENLIHMKSNGNPGWIEALLISLMQSHEILIRNADYSAINQCGLVAPPLYMMRRMSPNNILKWKQIMEEKSSMAVDKTIDKWNLYIDTCRDEDVDIILREKIHQACSRFKVLPVCLLNLTGNFADLDAELTKEVSLISTFDSLTYHEQALLKVSCVLGDSFARGLLLYVMQSDNELRGTAEVVQTLFEKRVLCCAKGDFSEGGNYLLIRERMIDPRKDMTIKCSCVGIYICDDVRDLPKYASCGYIRFVSSEFREITYNLLTDAQKKSCHARAAKYLLRETRKCSSCGGAYFDWSGYCKVEHDKMKPTIPQKKISGDPSDHLLSPFGSMYSAHTDKSSVHTSMSHLSYGRKTGMQNTARSMGRSTGLSITGSSMNPAYGPMMEDDDEDMFYAQNFGILKPFKVYKFKDKLTLTKPFSTADFQNCHCHLILNYLYNQLTHHYQGSGQWLEMIIAMIGYAVICIDQKNYAEALNAVKNALNYLSTSADSLEVPSWKIPILEAKLYTWYGKILSSQEQQDEALKMLMIAMSKFGYPFPKRKITLHIKLWMKRLKHKLGIYLCPDKFHDQKLSKDDIDVVDSISCCLNKMFDIFVQSNRLKEAELSAVWSLTKALEAGTNLFQVCNGFCTTILMANYRKRKYWSIVLEVHALRFCHKKKYGLDPPELKAIIRLYYVIFETRLTRAEFDEALQMGYVLTRLTDASNNTRMTIKTLGSIAVMLLYKLLLSECVTILQELSFHMTEQDSAEEKAEFYYSVLMFQLETGYSFTPFKDIEKYYQAECLLKPCPGQMKFLTILRSWYARIHQWEATKIVSSQMTFSPIKQDTVEMTTHTRFCMQLLADVEYQLMMLVRKINKRNIFEKIQFKKKIASLWKQIKNRLKYVPIGLPRYYMLKAYEAMIWDNESKMLKFLDKSRKSAVKQDNLLFQRQCDFLEEYWLEQIGEEEAQAWIKQTEPENYLEYNQLNHGDMIVCYPFAPPLFY